MVHVKQWLLLRVIADSTSMAIFACMVLLLVHLPFISLPLCLTVSWHSPRRTSLRSLDCPLSPLPCALLFRGKPIQKEGVLAATQIKVYLSLSFSEDRWILSPLFFFFFYTDEAVVPSLLNRQTILSASGLFFLSLFLLPLFVENNKKAFCRERKRPEASDLPSLILFLNSAAFSSVVFSL